METKNKEKKLQLIPKTEKYMQYMLEVILKLPRTEKFSIGNEYKKSMYKMIRDIIHVTKRENNKCIEYLNNIDAELNIQRIYIRIMYKNKWIDEKKYKISMEMIYEIGKILGGLIKYYVKNNKK